MEKLDISKIVQVPLPTSQYYKEICTKKQIVLHHTAGASNAKNVINGWANTEERVATPFVIDDKGVIHQAYSSKYWAHHLGTKFVNNTTLNKGSVGIEITNWGPLSMIGDKFYNYVKKEVPIDQVYELKEAFRGHKYYHRYTDAQIESAKKLIIYLSETYNIPLTYNEDMWNVGKNATSGKSGIYTHVSYRSDKSDLYPHAGMIEMLKNLK